MADIPPYTIGNDQFSNRLTLELFERQSFGDGETDRERIGWAGGSEREADRCAELIRQAAVSLPR